VEPEDGAGLAAVMFEAVCSAEERNQRGAAARDDATARFSWKGVGESLLGLLDEVTATAEVATSAG